MKWVFLTTALGRRCKVIFSDSLNANLRNVTKRRYCEKRTIKELQGYRKTPDGGPKEGQEHGYLVLIFPFTTLLLGLWQVKRQFWKTDLKNFLNSRYEEEPVPLPENIHSVGQFDALGSGMYENHPFYKSLDTYDWSQLEYRRVKVRGEFQYDKEFYLGPTTGPVPIGPGGQQFAITEHRAPGFYLVTPFKLEGRNYTIMVNRGFLPEKLLLDKPTRLKSQVHGPQELTGIVRFDQDTRYAKYFLSGDVNKMSKREDLNYIMVRHIQTMAKHSDSAPIYMECLPQNFGPNSPSITATAKAELRDDHTTYAFIWFSLTFITTYMWYTAYRPGRTSLLIHKTMEMQKNFQRNPRVK